MNKLFTDEQLKNVNLPMLKDFIKFVKDPENRHPLDMKTYAYDHEKLIQIGPSELIEHMPCGTTLCLAGHIPYAAFANKKKDHWLPVLDLLDAGENDWGNIVDALLGKKEDNPGAFTETYLFGIRNPSDWDQCLRRLKNVLEEATEVQSGA